jgi:hypothetical protein
MRRQTHYTRTICLLNNALEREIVGVDIRLPLVLPHQFGNSIHFRARARKPRQHDTVPLIARNSIRRHRAGRRGRNLNVHFRLLRYQFRQRRALLCFAQVKHWIANEQGRSARAPRRRAPLYERAAHIDEKVLGPNHPALATDLNNLATLSLDRGTFADAEPLLLRALSIRQKAFGPEHPGVAQRWGDRDRMPIPGCGVRVDRGIRRRRTWPCRRRARPSR